MNPRNFSTLLLRCPSILPFGLILASLSLPTVSADGTQANQSGSGVWEPETVRQSAPESVRNSEAVDRSSTTQTVQFNRDIRPILSETCFHCHGPDDEGRQADLRLDTVEGATEDLGGYSPIVPHDLDDSEVWNRIVSGDPDTLMPPPESKMVLDGKQKDLIKVWIQQGATYQDHWAFAKPDSPVIPDSDFTRVDPADHVTSHPISRTAWCQNDIDRFVADQLVASEHPPSNEVDARTLLRRLSFDLTGLPPTLTEVRQFESDYASLGEQAWQDEITRLLGSKHFGERMALAWMDQARYADTNGYSIDGGRDMWLYRDWVIQAYNDNMPFDQFLTEQLAGDLLPDASTSQKIASGFNRNHMVTHEGGTIPAENLTNYVADRVKTTSEVFLGLTMACAQCHDHKYDPISQQDYYRFFAFFNELSDRGLDGNAGVNPGPRIQAKTVIETDEVTEIQREFEVLSQRLSSTTDGFQNWLDELSGRIANRGEGFRLLESQLLDVSSPNRPGPYEVKSDQTVYLSSPSRGLNAFSHALQLVTADIESGESINGIRIEFLPPQSDSNKLTPFADGVPKITTVLVSAGDQAAKQVELHKQQILAEATASSWGNDHHPASVLDERNLDWWQPSSADHPQHLTLTFATAVDPKQQAFLTVMVFFGTSESLPFNWRITPFTGIDDDLSVGDDVAKVIKRYQESGDLGQLSETDKQTLLSAYRADSPSLAGLRNRIANLSERLDTLTKPFQAMVMDTAPKPRQTFVLSRGQYDSPMERVTPGVPSALPSWTDTLPKQDQERSLNRLDLAHWMTHADHPLTARVAVNRIWALFFGLGIVRTSADFGSQGDWPSHPKLLDYLATQFIANGWDQKQLIRTIVSSATYRQDSTVKPKQRVADPDNRMLGRGSRFRLVGEFIRDQALAKSGLLVDRMGGPSVQPYQPPGLWKEVSHFGSTPATKQVFVQDHGEKLYRRSLYTFVKRTSPHPAMSAFDAPNREMCIVQRSVTNTPMQALVTLNDPQFAEAARVLAAKWLSNRDARSDRQLLEYAFEDVTLRNPKSSESVVLEKLLKSKLVHYRVNYDQAEAITEVGESSSGWRVEDGAADKEARFQSKSNDDRDSANATSNAARQRCIEQAAWTQIATLLLNLSETLTRS